MNIKSYFLKQEGREHYILLDVLVDGKQFAASLGIGQMENGNFVSKTLTGMEALNRLVKYSKQLEGSFGFVEMNNMERVKSRVEIVFSNLKDGDTVFFVCKDSKVWDEVAKELNIDYSDLKSKPI